MRKSAIKGKNSHSFKLWRHSVKRFCQSDSEIEKSLSAIAVDFGFNNFSVSGNNFILFNTSGDTGEAVYIFLTVIGLLLISTITLLFILKNFMSEDMALVIATLITTFCFIFVCFKSNFWEVTVYF